LVSNDNIFEENTGGGKWNGLKKDSPSMLSSLQMTLAPHQLLLPMYG